MKERAILLLKQEMLKRQDVPSTSTSVITTNSSVIPSSSSSSISSSTSSTSCSSTFTSFSITTCSSARKNLLMEIFDKQHVVPAKSSVEEELEKYLISTS